MLFIFDKDGTLVDGPAGRPPNKPEEQSLMPGVLEVIARLRAEGHLIALASNQGGVAWGFISMDDADALMRDCAQKIGGVDAYRFCPHDPRKGQFCECRKPRPGMILSIMAELGISDPGQVVFVGDQESDRQAAEAAGVRFVWADQFFG